MLLSQASSHTLSIGRVDPPNTTMVNSTTTRVVVAMVLRSSWLPKSCLSLRFSASAYAIAPRSPGEKKLKNQVKYLLLVEASHLKIDKSEYAC